MRLVSVVAACAIAGLASGVVESLIGQGWRHLAPWAMDSPDLWRNWHTPWMAPLGLAAWLAGYGLVASVVGQILPRTVRWLGPRLAVGLGAWSALSAVPGLDDRATLFLAACVGWRGGERLSFERGMSVGGRWARGSLIAVGVVWLALGVSTGLLPATAEWRVRQWTPSPRGQAPNVVLIVLDTVRADHLGLYGYERTTSPRLDARARRAGVTFAQARSTTPYTLGSHASLFTGRWAHETSARTNAALDGSLPTLAERFRDRGYATGGFTGNIFYGSAYYGLDRGFTRYVDIPGNITRRVTAREILRSASLGSAAITYFERKTRTLAPMQRQRFDAARVNREVLEWLDEVQAGDRRQPFFLFINYFDAHSPYSLPAEAGRRHARITPERLEALLKRRQALEEQMERLGGGDQDPAVAAAFAQLDAETTGHLRDIYDDGIAFVDEQLDALLEAIEARGVLDNTVVVITSDHGEMLGEHGQIGHGNGVYRPVIEVPLVILGAAGMGVPKGAVVKHPATIRDIPATLLELTGMATGAGALPGRSLARMWNDPKRTDDSSDPADIVLSSMEHMPWQPRRKSMPPASGPMWCLTDAGQYSYHRQDHEQRGRIEWLFDLAADPGEIHNLAGKPEQQERLSRLRRALDQVMEPSMSIADPDR